jgi:Ca2+-binding EF-hand superfamily protein
MTRCILVIAMLTLGSCASHKDVHNDRGSRFNAADTNHDGKLSRDEASDFLVGEIFDSRDANHDGKMTEKEWTGGDPARLEDFKKRDANHDGIVTKEEALAYGRKYGVTKQIFEEADKNHDGYLSRAEAQTYYASRE